MEFSNAYAIAPAFSSVTKTLLYNWATFTYEDGTPIPGAGSQRGRSVIAETLLKQPVYAILDKADDATRQAMRAAQPNFFLPFDRMNIDPFTQLFPVTLRCEGTVRGTGGIRIVDESCATTVAGLYAAGDAATRELICGGFTGGGSHNAAWALSSGRWAGEAAADYALKLGITANQRSLLSLGTVAMQSNSSRTIDVDQVIADVQSEVFPYDRNYFRTEAGLTESLDRLNGLWFNLRNSRAADTKQIVRSREAAAMVATARWMYSSALNRKESRGMHRHLDYPQQDPNQKHHLLSGGLDQVWVNSESLDASSERVLVGGVA
jgi:succinate dehydrogenase/fumarate reductase flavoprotein subunit